MNDDSLDLAIDAIDRVRRSRGEEMVEAYKLRATQNVLAIRERELLDLKGPCSTAECRLHFAHSGPCEIG